MSEAKSGAAAFKRIDRFPHVAEFTIGARLWRDPLAHAGCNLIKSASSSR
jgi:hypothetical protein